MANLKACVLLVEDNPRIQIANKDMLELQGYSVNIAPSLSEARKSLVRQRPDVIVLDIMLPDGNGLDLLRELRADRDTSDIPVLMLTALGTSDDMVKGLSDGADDYVAKPYEYTVLAARIEAVLRRTGKVKGKVRKGPLELDVLAARAYLHGVDILLKPKEFAILLFMAQNENKCISAKQLYETVWKMPFANDSQALRTVVSRLRRKLADTGYTIPIQHDDSSYCFRVDE
ncbi:MAG: response regulator transcription factor [Clostridiales bacterium]|jgi:DNA-binding response OmpR family regulator|nr:response regulator transcription factor [Clostridiales bacterium]